MASSFFTVRISKPTPDARLGILLVQREEGQPPQVESMKVGGLGQQSELWPGDIILTINGQKVLDDEDASKLIRKAETEVVMGVERGHAQMLASRSEQPGPLASQLVANVAKFFDCGICGIGGKGKKGDGEQAPVIQ